MTPSAVRMSGATRLYAIVGDPIAQVRSPEVFTERFAAAGVDAVLIPAHVPGALFDAIIPALMALRNLDGILVTVPFKARMLRFAARVGPTAECIGAINALRRETDGSWTGDMFDGAGFVRGALQKGERIRERRVRLYGAGGAGSAIACALADAGAASIDIVDPDAVRADALAAAVAKAFPACATTVATTGGPGFDMIVNASPVGMRPEDGLPGDIGSLAPGTLIGDVIIAATPTPLIRHAIQHGAHWVNGRDMHAGQVDALLGFFAASTAPASVPAAR